MPVDVIYKVCPNCGDGFYVLAGVPVRCRVCGVDLVAPVDPPPEDRP